MAGVIINAKPARLKHSAMIRPSVRLSRAPATQQGGNLGGKSAKTQQKPLNQSISIDKRSLVLNCLYDCIYFRGFFGGFFFLFWGVILQPVFAGRLIPVGECGYFRLEW